MGRRRPRWDAGHLLNLAIVIFLFVVSPLGASEDSTISVEGAEEEETFSEELLLRPLPDRKVLAHFHFRSTAPSSASTGHHHNLFPKAIAQLIRKFRVRELELSFTQGRWNYEKWGGFDPMSTNNAKPPGVELWAEFDDASTELIDTTWEDLTHSLSGLFCASINFLESSTAYCSPKWAFRSNVRNLRYGALPREVVCTENLTPWLKLLPCRDKAGISSLLDRPSIYKGHYHSQRLRLISDGFGIVVEQLLTVVLQPSMPTGSPVFVGNRPHQPSWSMSQLFRKKMEAKCELAKNSKIFVEIERFLLDELHNFGSEVSWDNALFKLKAKPDNEIEEFDIAHNRRASLLYEYDVAPYNAGNPLDVGMVWKLPATWSCLQAPFSTRRFFTGSGNERGSIAMSLESSSSNELLLRESSGCFVRTSIFQVVPWYVKMYYHTLRIVVDGKLAMESDVVERIQVTPSEDKLYPGTLEMMLKLPCSMRSAIISLDFDKGFLHIDEYPPDANQGFDIPSALVSFPDLHSSRSYSVIDSSDQSPLLRNFKEKSSVRSYTEVLLVPLTTPDFSMPYNVITFTCTVLALYFGSLLNVLRRRIGEEERLAKSKAKVGLIPLLISKIKGEKAAVTAAAGPSSRALLQRKLVLKVVIVALVAIGWHYLSDK